MRRHVAQPGSAPSWGVGGRRFKSSRADQKHIENQPLTAGFLLCAFCTGNHWGKTGEKYRQKNQPQQAVIPLNTENINIYKNI